MVCKLIKIVVLKAERVCDGSCSVSGKIILCLLFDRGGPSSSGRLASTSNRHFWSDAPLHTSFTWRLSRTNSDVAR